MTVTELRLKDIKLDEFTVRLLNGVKENVARYPW